MPNNPRSRVWTQFPRDHNLGHQSQECLDWMVTQFNQLLNQAGVPPSQNLASFGINQIDPTTAQIISKGSRTAALATGISAVMTTTTATFYWDGSNSSQPFQILRDDGSIFGPFITGSGLVCTGLVANTNYFFYPYFDETRQVINFANVPGVSVGDPAIAFTAQSLLAAQQQILRGRIALGMIGNSTGVTTPNAGSTTLKLGSGGAGTGIGGNGKFLP